VATAKGYKDWDALLTAAVRKGMEDGKAPGNVGDWHYGNWHVVDLEHPLAGFLPLVAASPEPARNRRAATPRR
jgi:penicillin amidase